MTIDSSDLDAARQAIERSVTQFNTNLATIYTHDGRHIYAPGKHENELAQLGAGVEKNVAKALALADKVTQETEASRLQPYADPTAQLSPADLADANLRSRWVAEDCSTMPLGDLAERLRAVAAGGSKSSQWLHARYAKARWAKESAKSNQPLDMDVFTATCRELGVFGERAGLSLEAQKRLEAAGSLSRWATRQLSIARDPAAEAAAKSAMAKEIHSWW